MKFNLLKYLSVLVFVALIITIPVTSYSKTYNGVTAGSFSVSPGGAATYTIPIEVPPGINGLQPNISLSYNSQGGNGLLGVGWQITGLSAITRCPRTLDQEGYIRGVKLDSSDAFCFDGQRLIAVQGAYGADGTVYRAEIDTLTKITSYGNTGYGPNYFIVKTNTGQTIEYGKTNDSQFNVKILSNNSRPPLNWAINRITDSSNNEAIYTYIEDSGGTVDQVLKEITYYKSNNQYNASVRFVYSTGQRGDKIHQFVAGAEIVTNQLLTNIQTYIGGSKIRDYQLTYIPAINEKRSLLNRVTECDGSNNCKKLNNFTWQNNNPTAYKQTEFTITKPSWDSTTVWEGDYNGDGKSDILSYWGGTFITFFSNGDGTYNQKITPVPYGSWDSRTVWTGDYDGDGKSDILSYWGGALITFLSNGDGYYTHKTHAIQNGSWDSTKVWTGDYNGDGRSDILSYWGGTFITFFSNGNGSYSQKITSVPYGSWDSTKVWTGDYDGDGQTDILSYYWGTFVTFYSGGDGYYTYKATPVPYGSWDSSTVWEGDYNGDGKSDILSYYWGTFITFYSNGDGYYTHKATPVPYGSWDSTKVWMGDYNSDGKSDILSYWGGTLITFLSKGDGYYTHKTHTVQNGSWDSNTVWMGDYDGDGKSDILSYWGGKLITFGRTESYADNIVNVSNGLGQESTIYYKPITDSSVYTKYSAYTYPFRNIQNSMHVVSSVDIDNGIGGTNTASYRYEGLKLHLRGRGLLGFSKVTTTDESTNTTSITDYYQQTETRDNYTLPAGTSDFWKTGLVKKSTTSVNGRLLSQVDNTWNRAWDRVLTSKGTIIPYLRKSVSTNRSYEKNATLSTTTSEVTSIDSWGNPITQVSSTRDVVTGETYTKTTTTPSGYWLNDESTWRIGLPLRVEVTSTIPSVPAGHSADQRVTRNVTALSYDTKGRIQSKIVEPGDSNLQLSTTYAYDPTYGYVSSVSTSGSGQTRTTATSIDYNYATDKYKVTNTNAMSHVEQRVYDKATGNLLELIGPNQLAAGGTQKTQMNYDSFGRKIKVILADGNATNTAYLDCSGDSACNPSGISNEVYYISKTASGKPNSKTFYDKLGRAVRSHADGFNNSIVESRTEYDGLGRVKGSTNSYFRGVSAPVPMWSCNEYDVLGRVTRKSTPTTNSCQYPISGPIFSKVTFDGLHATTTIYNSTGVQTKQSWKNVIGKTTKVTDSLYNSSLYFYNALGQLIEVEDANSNSVRTKYDKLGRKITMDDPDMGHWEYDYNAFGNMTWQKDAKAQVVSMGYDKLGRMTSRSAPGESSSWTYDSCYRGIGKLCKTRNNTSGYQQVFEYDSLGRPKATLSTIKGASYRVDRTFDSVGRISKTSYPYALGSRFEVQNCYDGKGYLKEVRAPGSCFSGGTVYWKANGANAYGKITNETLGNGINTARMYDSIYGRLTDISSGSGTTFQSNQYEYDTIGNLTQRLLSSRVGVIHDIKENYSYDDINRLEWAKTTGPFSQIALEKTYGYDAIGNIKSKSDYGNDYRYNSSKPHAVTSVYNGGTRRTIYAYDANGFMTSSNGKVISPTWFSKPAAINSNGNTTNFEYDTTNMRIYQSSSEGTMVYLNPRIDKGGHYEKEIKDGAETHKHYIYGASGVVAVHEKKQSSNQTKYFLKDHLGSIEVITDQNGTQLERLSYDAFGKRRKVDGGDSPIQIHAVQSHHGFTGHEHLDDYGIIHMNGRLYDPNLGRFMAADPFVKYVGSTQGFNRYSYTDNNPLSRVDLNGYSWISKKWKRARKKIAQATTDLISKVSKIKYVGGLLSIGLMTNNSFSVAYGASTGDWKSVGRAHAAGAVISAGYYYGGAAANGYSSAITAEGATAATYFSAGAQYVAHSAAVGYASSYSMARIYGASHNQAMDAGRNGSITSARTALLDAISLAMRQHEIARSPDVSGPSDGIRGISGKLGGCRCEDPGFFDFGGMQKGAGDIFGVGYEAGGFGDSLVESFAGAHDFFNDMWGMYDASGATMKNISGIQSVMNVVNVFIAAPLAVATFKQHYQIGTIEHSQSLATNYY